MTENKVVKILKSLFFVVFFLIDHQDLDLWIDLCICVNSFQVPVYHVCPRKRNVNGQRARLATNQRQETVLISPFQVRQTNMGTQYAVLVHTNKKINNHNHIHVTSTSLNHPSSHCMFILCFFCTFNSRIFHSCDGVHHVVYVATTWKRLAPGGCNVFCVFIYYIYTYLLF